MVELLEFYKYALEMLDEKLKELMLEDDYIKFSRDVAKSGFRKEIEGMKEGEFKDFCLDNFDAITEDRAHES